MTYKNIERCRFCGNTSLVSVLSLGEQYLTTRLAESSTQAEKVPLEVVLCPSCGLAQLTAAVPPDQLFRKYPYRSSLSATMRAAVDDAAQQAVRRVTITYKDSVLDIGSNDAAIFHNYPPEVWKLGFEPSGNMGWKRVSFDTWECAGKPIQGAALVTNYFTEARYKMEREDEKTKIITSLNVFQSVEEPQTFIKEISNILHPRGLWLNEFDYLPLTLKNNPVALIYCDKDKAGAIAIPKKELMLLKTLRNQALLAIKQTT